MSESVAWNPEDSRLRKIASHVGLGIFTVGLHIRVLELSETQDFISKSAILTGLVMTFAPILKEFQDYRAMYKDVDQDGEDDDDDDDWPDDDPSPDPGPPPPGGLHAESTMINEIEVFLEQQSLSGVA